MHKFLFIIQTLIIIVLLVICATLAIQLNEYQLAYGKLSHNNSATAPTLTASGSAMPQPSASENQLPNFDTANNSATNTPEVESALGVVAQNGATGYRVTKDNKKIVYMTPEHMVMLDVATKQEQELVSFKTYDRKLAGDGKECVPGSRFVKPMFNETEDIIYFGAPAQGKDALYVFPLSGKEAKLVTLVDNCITDIAVSPKGLNIAYQTANVVSTMSEGYVTDLYIVQADGTNSQMLAKEGKLPQHSLVDGTTQHDFAPAQIVWTNEQIFYMKGYSVGTPTGIWKFDSSKKVFEAVSNLKGGP